MKQYNRVCARINLDAIAYNMEQMKNRIGALKMGEKYRERYHLYFKNPDIREFDLQHEELFCCQPVRWAEEVVECCK